MSSIFGTGTSNQNLGTQDTPEFAGLTINGDEVLTEAGNQNVAQTLTTSQVAFLNNNELVTKFYVDTTSGVGTYQLVYNADVSSPQIQMTAAKDINYVSTTSQNSLTIFADTDGGISTKKIVLDGNNIATNLSNLDTKTQNITGSVNLTDFTGDIRFDRIIDDVGGQLMTTGIDDITITAPLTVASIMKTGGTATQYFMANGTVSQTTLLSEGGGTSLIVDGTGPTLSLNSIIAGDNIKFGAGLGDITISTDLYGLPYLSDNWLYIYNLSGIPDPTNGNLKYDNNDPAIATLIRISTTTWHPDPLKEVDRTQMMNYITSFNILYIQQKNNKNNWQRWGITGTPTIISNVLTINITLLQSNGTGTTGWTAFDELVILVLSNNQKINNLETKTQNIDISTAPNETFIYGNINTYNPDISNIGTGSFRFNGFFNNTNLKGNQTYGTNARTIGNIIPSITTTDNIGSSILRYSNIFTDITNTNLLTVNSSMTVPLIVGSTTISGNITPTINNNSNLGTALLRYNNIFGTTITGNTIVKSGGLSTEFLKADGTTDSNTYLTSSNTTITNLQTKTQNIDLTTIPGTTYFNGSIATIGGTNEELYMRNGGVLNLKHVGFDCNATTTIINLNNLQLRWNGTTKQVQWRKSNNVDLTYGFSIVYTKPGATSIYLTSLLATTQNTWQYFTATGLQNALYDGIGLGGKFEITLVNTFVDIMGFSGTIFWGNINSWGKAVIHAEN